MKRLGVVLGMTALVLFTSGVVLARRKVLYVKVRAAKLRTSTNPGDTGYVAFLPYGTVVEVLEEQPPWTKVRVSSAQGVFEGWVHRSQLQARRPRREASRSSKLATALSGIDRTKVDATKSASSRGLLQSDNYAKSRNVEKELRWIEQVMLKYVPSEEDLDRFMQEGRLGPYREN